MEITPGQVYGHLTVVEPVMVSGNRHWRYRCICGKTGVKRPAHIRTKGSCGCLVGKPEGDWISTKKAMEMLGHRDHGSFHAYARNNEISRSTDVNNPYRVWWSGADIRLHAEKREKERTAERRCAECGGINSKGYSDYCSNKCGRTAQIRKLKTIHPKHKKPCKHCGQLFESTTKVYCSEECRRNQWQIDNPEPLGPPKPPKHVMAWIRKCQRVCNQVESEEATELTPDEQWRKRCRSAVTANRYREGRLDRLQHCSRSRKARGKAESKQEAIRWWLSKITGIVSRQEPERDHTWLWKRKCANAVTNHRKRLERKDVRQSRSIR